jgi:hypothetical protein
LHAENIFVGIVVPENKIFYAALIVGQYCNVACKRTSGLTVIPKILLIKRRVLCIDSQMILVIISLRHRSILIKNVGYMPVQCGACE